jgi:hypothetical protein
MSNSHIQQSIELMTILPALAHGANCVVLTCIGLFEADPLGASKRDILDYTGLSRQTVEKALRFLEVSDLIEYDSQTKRYHAERFYRFGAKERVEIRELVPIMQGEIAPKNVKKFSTSSSSSRFSTELNLKDSSTPTLLEVEKILQGANLRTCDLRLQEMTVEDAKALASYIEENPGKKQSPAGYVYRCLQNNPKWLPPFTIKPKAWYSGHEEFVNR